MAEVIIILTRWVKNNYQLCNHIMQAQSPFHFLPFHFHSNRIRMNFLGFSRHSRNTGYSFILSRCKTERCSAVCVFIWINSSSMQHFWVIFFLFHLLASYTPIVSHSAKTSCWLRSRCKHGWSSCAAWNELRPKLTVTYWIVLQFKCGF